jgi:hypothetical protein
MSMRKRKKGGRRSLGAYRNGRVHSKGFVQDGSDCMVGTQYKTIQVTTATGIWARK